MSTINEMGAGLIIKESTIKLKVIPGKTRRRAAVRQTPWPNLLLIQ
jgi:hypothetical protein